MFFHTVWFEMILFHAENWYKLQENINKYRKSNYTLQKKRLFFFALLFFEKRRNWSYRKDMKFNFSKCWRSDSVQNFIFSTWEYRPEYISSDKREELVLMCSQVGNRLERYGATFIVFGQLIIPPQKKGIVHRLVRSFSTKVTAVNTEEHRAEISGASPMFLIHRPASFNLISNGVHQQ